MCWYWSGKQLKTKKVHFAKNWVPTLLLRVGAKKGLLSSPEAEVKFVEGWSEPRMVRLLRIVARNKMPKKWILVISGKILRHSMKNVLLQLIICHLSITKLPCSLRKRAMIIALIYRKGGEIVEHCSKWIRKLLELSLLLVDECLKDMLNFAASFL